MRFKTLIVVLACLGVATLAFSMSGRSQKPEEQPEFEIIEIGTGADPQWSPDGTKIAFRSGSAWVRGIRMFLANADGEGEIQELFEIPKTAYRYHWLDSNEFVFQERELVRENEKGRLLYTIDRRTAITLNGQKRLIVEVIREPGRSAPFHISAPMFLPDGTVGYYEVPPGKKIWETENSVFRVIKQGKLPPDSAVKQMIAFEHDLSVPGHIDRSIWLQSVDGSIKKRISSCDHCSFPKLSPDGTRILVMCGGKCSVCVLDLGGNEICVGKESINPVDPFDTAFVRGCVDGLPIWSPDGKKIAYGYLRYKSISEHDVKAISSEVYVENPDGTNRTQIIISDEAETGPVWSPDGTRIICTGYHSGRIYVATLK